MHEFSLLKDLMKKINEVTAENKADRVSALTVQLGALSHISADHFREHFEHAAKGTVVEHARLDIVEAKDETAPDAMDILLKDIELETDE